MSGAARTTIAAIATPLGRGGIGVIRLSGPQAAPIAQQLTGRPLPAPRQAQRAVFVDEGGQTIDEGLVLFFASPHSFTGEDVVELQGHGGRVVQQALLERLYALGAVAAQPGEFSARAFELGKMDLVQAEAIADLIDASSAAAARSALRSMQGQFSARVETLLEQLIHLRLHVEAAIDFPEEEIDFLADGRILDLLEQVQRAVQAVQDSARQGQLLREGLQVVIAGPPNAGKSSLLNALAGAERAIVTDIAGTTRDVLHEKITLNGLPLTLTDTAGLRDTTDVIEQEGIRRAYREIEQADVLLLVHDAQRDPDPMPLLKQFFGAVDPRQVLVVSNKCDLTRQPAIRHTDAPLERLWLSAQTGAGLPLLIEALCERVGYQPQEDTFIARTRHVEALRRTAQHLCEAHEQLTVHAAGELVAESLRCAQQALGEITGAFSADDLLGRIFGSFCIGK